MTCADVNERMIDFLYGELDEESRRAFDAHLIVCDACRAEVESLGGTLGQARVVLAAADEPVPLAVKEGAEKLVEMVAKRGGRPFRTLGAPVIPEDAGGLWGLLRRPWFFPVFAAVSVIGLFFLAQEAILHRAMPLTPAERAQESVGVATGAGTPGPGAPLPDDQTQGKGTGAAADDEGRAPAGPVIEPLTPRPSEARAKLGVMESSPAADRQPPAPESASGAIGTVEPPAPSAAIGGREFATPPAKAVRRELVNPFASPPADQDGMGAGRPPAVTTGAARGVATDPNATQDPWRAREVSRPAPGTYRAQGASAGAAAAPSSNFANEVVEPFTTDMRRKVASPQVPARKAKAQAPVPAQAESDLEESGGLESAPGAPAAAAPAPAAEPASAPPPAPASAAAAPKRADAPEDSQRALITLGDRLVAEKRWGEAVVVYRSLIARYPKHPDLPAWKRRLELATELSAP